MLEIIYKALIFLILNSSKQEIERFKITKCNYKIEKSGLISFFNNNL